MAESDDFFESAGGGRRANWVVVVFGVLTLAVVALPLIAIFTDWL